MRFNSNIYHYCFLVHWGSTRFQFNIIILLLLPSIYTLKHQASIFSVAMLLAIYPFIYFTLLLARESPIISFEGSETALTP